MNDAVTDAGSLWLAQMPSPMGEPSQSSQGWTVIAQAGSTGPTGAAGAAATVAIGSVATLPPGSPATVTMTGTPTAALLNFGLPQGATGPPGSGGGAAAASSNSFAAMYHAVSYASTFYSVNTPNANPLEDASVLAWIPQGCTATALNVFSQQSNTITVTLRLGTPGHMADTALACEVAPGATCSASGSVSIPAGSFLDLSMLHTSGTAAPVWTSLTCSP